MTNWNREHFAYWLKLQRRVEHPMSQDHLAELLGDDVTQSRISRWEKGLENTDAPTLDQCLRLADIFDDDFIEVAEMCGRWNDDLERRILSNLRDDNRAKGRYVSSLSRTLQPAT